LKDVRFTSEKKGMYYPIYYLNFLTCSDYGLLGYDAVQSYQWIPFWRNMAPPYSQVQWWVRRQCIKGRIQGRCSVRFTDGREENVVWVNIPPHHCFCWLRLQCTYSPFSLEQISHLPCSKPAQSTESLIYSFWSGRWKQYIHLKCVSTYNKIWCHWPEDYNLIMYKLKKKKKPLIIFFHTAMCTVEVQTFTMNYLTLYLKNRIITQI
jgi:hypothetical protein